jgi:cytochrome c biogenesis protein ResB
MTVGTWFAGLATVLVAVTVVCIIAGAAVFVSLLRERRRFWAEYEETRDRIRETENEMRRGARPKAGRFKL